MSHEIIKNISINHKTKEVFITSASNNCYPRTPKKWAADYFADIYKAEGLEALEKRFLREFMTGNMQKGNSDYCKSLSVFGSPVLFDFDKVEYGFADNYGYDLEAAYNNLLKYRAAKRDKVAIKLNGRYVTKLTARRAFLSHEKAGAKVFSMAEFEIIKKRFSNADCMSEAI